jgi:hypothetical protein
MISTLTLSLRHGPSVKTNKMWFLTWLTQCLGKIRDQLLPNWLREMLTSFNRIEFHSIPLLIVSLLNPSGWEGLQWMTKQPKLIYLTFQVLIQLNNLAMVNHQKPVTQSLRNCSCQQFSQKNQPRSKMMEMPSVSSVKLSRASVQPKANY